MVCVGRIDCLCFGAKAAEGGLLFVRADPGCDRGRGDRAAGFRLQALGSFAERVAQVIERERLQHHADRVGLVAKRGRAGREQALARAAAPELHDLEFFLANAFAGDGVSVTISVITMTYNSIVDRPHSLPHTNCGSELLRTTPLHLSAPVVSRRILSHLYKLYGRITKHFGGKSASKIAEPKIMRKGGAA